MKKQQQIEAILELLQEKGLSIEQIEENLNFSIERRTLQRRLKELKESNRLLTKGEARSTRYFPKVKKYENEASDDLIPLSIEGKKILKLISLSEIQRIPVGYNKQFLENYQQIIAKAIEKHTFKNKPAELYEPMNYIIGNAGKRLRPIMVLMACDLFNGNTEKAIKPALAIEYFHNFTLIHDDIMDEAPLRRNNPTIHTLHGINVGILSGDALLIKAYQFFEDLEPELFKKCIQIFSETGAVLCEGQQMDVNFETMEDVTYDNYIEMITNKTGVLSAASFKIGALIADAKEEEAEHLYNFGKHIGIAFQIMDDYLDVFGDVEQFGKKHAGDIFENKKTILYLLAMEHATEEEKKELDYWYSKKTENIDKVYSVEKIFRRAKVDEKVLRLIHKHNEIGHDYLSKINLPEEKKKPFKELAGYLLRRES